MKFIIGEMKTKGIVNGIFITGLVYFIITILRGLNIFLPIPGTPGDSILISLFVTMNRIYTFAILILGLILLKLVCEVLYKIVKASEIIIEKYHNK